MQQFINTPFFMFNSKYDAWQLGNELQTPWTTKPEQAHTQRPHSLPAAVNSFN